MAQVIAYCPDINVFVVVEASGTDELAAFFFDKTVLIAVGIVVVN